MAMADDDPDIFTIFACFIYSGKILSTRQNDVEVYPDGSRRDREWARLGKAWVLGDKLQATVFKDAVADAICEKVAQERKWPTTLHQIIYPQTTPAARDIRRLCVDIAVSKWAKRTLARTMRNQSWSDFFEDVKVRSLEMQKGEKRSDVDFGRPGCRYHEHVAEATKCWRDMRFL